ncbi:MAG: EAL domain-containing protein [Aquificae bacterium]|nr:EAL domain-containing protein [Aquificota bacterium]
MILNLHFDIDIIKLDGSLVKNIDKDLDNQIIVGGIAYICQKKGIKLLAEMVETKEELETLKKLGVSYAQGFLFGRASSRFVH